MPATDLAPFRKKTKVRVTTDLPGVPEGTAGVVKDTVGFALPRHRVQFENGRLVLSIAHDKLVEADGWDDFVARREQAARQVEAAAEVAAPAPDDDAGAAPAAAADDRLAALLARSKAAHEKKGEA